MTTTVYLTWGRYDESLRIYIQLLEYFTEKGDEDGIARTLHQLGLIHQDKGEYDAALERYNESLEIRKRFGDQGGIATTLGQLGILLASTENYKDAIAYLLTSYNFFEKLKFDPQKQIVLQNIEKIKNKIGENEFNTLIQSLSSDEKDVAQ